jgi:serine/threonine protein kinase
MPEIGRSVSHYKILHKLGAGGMGEVYRAQDTNLNRQVAIKVLPDVFSGDAERLARFEREAQLLASLNHPNIAIIFGMERVERELLPVGELVEGQTLAQRLEKGPLPVRDFPLLCSVRTPWADPSTWPPNSRKRSLKRMH